MHSLRVLVAGVTAAVALACSSESSPPEPSRTPTPPSAVTELPVAQGAMSPGVYTFAAFEPAVTFRVSTGWSAGHDHSQFFDIWREPGAALAFARPDYLVGPDGRMGVSGLTPRQVVETLAANPRVTRHRIDGGVAVGDRAGPGLELRMREGGHLFGIPDGAFDTVPSSVRMLIVALSVRGEIVLVMHSSLQPPHAEHRRLTTQVARTVRFP